MSKWLLILEMEDLVCVFRGQTLDESILIPLPIISHNMLTNNLVRLDWVSKIELCIYSTWPSFSTAQTKQVSFQKVEFRQNIPTGYLGFVSITSYLISIADIDKKKIIYIITFKFKGPINPKNSISKVFEVNLTVDDIEET